MPLNIRLKQNDYEKSPLVIKLDKTSLFCIQQKRAKLNFKSKTPTNLSAPRHKQKQY